MIVSVATMAGAQYIHTYIHTLLLVLLVLYVVSETCATKCSMLIRIQHVCCVAGNPLECNKDIAGLE